MSPRIYDSVSVPSSDMAGLANNSGSSNSVVTPDMCVGSVSPVPMSQCSLPASFQAWSENEDKNIGCFSCKENWQTDDNVTSHNLPTKKTARLQGLSNSVNGNSENAFPPKTNEKLRDKDRNKNIGHKRNMTQDYSQVSHKKQLIETPK